MNLPDIFRPDARPVASLALAVASVGEAKAIFPPGRLRARGDRAGG
jgi:hypothetical protein